MNRLTGARTQYLRMHTTTKTTFFHEEAVHRRCLVRIKKQDSMCAHEDTKTERIKTQGAKGGEGSHPKTYFFESEGHRMSGWWLVVVVEGW